MNRSPRTLPNRNQAPEFMTACAVLLLGAISVSGQTFTNLATFNPSTQGTEIETPLVQGLDGNFYGAANLGGTSKACGASGCGTLFRVTPQGSIAVVYTFIAGSEHPGERLQIASDGSFFTTTFNGGPFGDGSVVRITPQGRISTLHAFSGADGSNPTEGVVQGMDGNFYGSTGAGGSSQNGTFFKINTAGLLTTYSLAGVATYGVPTPLAQAADGNFYGTFIFGGANDQGAVIKFTRTGTVTVLHTFAANEGDNRGGIVGSDGNLYGTTLVGGTADLGSVFRITLAGAYTVLHSFTGTDGQAPRGLTVGTDGNFYGLTGGGGSNNFGTIYQLTPQGQLTTLYNFCSLASCADGGGGGEIIQGTDGDFYGTISGGGGAIENATFFKLSMGLAPFIKTVPISGAVGRQVKIVGNNLAGATLVTFNGTPSPFTVISATAIATTVPTGASSGPVLVTTPTGTLKSNISFQVP